MRRCRNGSKDLIHGGGGEEEEEEGGGGGGEEEEEEEITLWLRPTAVI